jgi:hypothetical protein
MPLRRGGFAGQRRQNSMPAAVSAAPAAIATAMSIEIYVQETAAAENQHRRDKSEQGHSFHVVPLSKLNFHRSSLMAFPRPA